MTPALRTRPPAAGVCTGQRHRHSRPLASTRPDLAIAPEVTASTQQTSDRQCVARCPLVSSGFHSDDVDHRLGSPGGIWGQIRGGDTLREPPPMVASGRTRDVRQQGARKWRPDGCFGAPGRYAGELCRWNPKYRDWSPPPPAVSSHSPLAASARLINSAAREKSTGETASGHSGGATRSSTDSR